jgi:hypothetical protein
VATDFNNQFDDASDDANEKDMKNTLNVWRESLEKEAERPDWFWARQRALLSSQVQQPKAKRMPALAWAGIAAPVALGVALAVPGDKQSVEVATDETPQVGQVREVPMTDPELMRQLEQTMNSRVPEALQPANALAQEMEQSYSGESTSKVKERTQ